MILYIDTTVNKYIKIAFKKDGRIVIIKKIPALYKQAEKLLPWLNKMLLKSNLKLNDIKKIIVNNRGGSFTSLRIGIITANTLGFALNIPVVSSESELIKANQADFNVIKPIYDREPSITIENF